VGNRLSLRMREIDDLSIISQKVSHEGYFAKVISLPKAYLHEVYLAEGLLSFGAVVTQKEVTLSNNTFLYLA